MARSDIKTWLPLDEFAQILGINPLSFNQLEMQDPRPSTGCGEIFFQYSWQHADRMGRDDIAMAIQQAEQEMAIEAGFNLMPDWTYNERLPYPRPGDPTLIGCGYNLRYFNKSVEVPRGHVISGGVRAKSLIQAGVSVTRTDGDGDGYSETCTVTVPVSITDTNEIHAYYPAQSGDDGWEIRPIKVSISGGNATITFKSWQISAANKMDSINAMPLDAASAASYETTVDIYRVYNDPSTQVTFMWENADLCCGSCNACEFGTQSGCIHLRDPRLGFVVPAPGTWDASSRSFTAIDYSYCREPDQVKLYYWSGYVDQSLSRPYAELSPYWKYAIAYFAASKFDRAVCGCSNVKEFIDKWRTDATFSNEGGGFNLPAEIIANRLGASMGAINAYRQINRSGVKVHK